MFYPLYIFFGLAPSFIWLLLYLPKDVHPESNRMVLKIFFYGMLISFVAAVIEMGIEAILKFRGILFNFSTFLFFFLYYFIGIALVEELFKYLVVKEKVLNNPEFDEPVDAMLYMIIAGLGFAAVENILVLFGKPFLETVTISALRFVGATFLHALCSGTLGYFLALSLFEAKKRKQLIVFGLLISAILHGLYNFSIIKTVERSYFIFIPIIILIGLAFFVSFGFRNLKKIRSVCKITRY